MSSEGVTEVLMAQDCGSEPMAGGNEPVLHGSEPMAGGYETVLHENRAPFSGEGELQREIERRLEERALHLEEALKELDSFSYSVSHELRAPLRTIVGLSQVLLMNCAASLPEEGQRHLQTIQRLGLQMDDMVKALLEFSRIGRKGFSPHETDPSGLLQQALDGLRADMEGRSVEIVTGVLPTCRAVPSLLRQVFSILLSNALKYTEKCEKAVIEIGCVKEKGQKAYFVRDNGIGLPASGREKLFTLFTRLHRDGDYEGTGVGLALARRIINRHGGNIWAESEEGKGAAFYFVLPDGPLSST